MAVSGLEQRCVPLVNSSVVWSPWGPGLIAPYPKDDYDAHSDELQIELEIVQKKRWRSHSWGGYSTHAQLTNRGCVPEPDVHNEPEMPPKRAVSNNIVAGAGEREQPGLKLRLSELIALPLEPAPSPRAAMSDKREPGPVLLGSRQTQVCAAYTQGAKGSVEPQAIPPTENVAKPGALGDFEKEAITTLAIRNLPYGLKQQDLLQKMDDSGFAGLYDFVYLPHHFRENRNLGFAFINFVSEDVARRFTAEWQDSNRFTSWSLRKPLNITPAVVQGRQANQQKAASHKMDRVKNSAFRPMLLHGSAGAHGVL